MNPVAVDGRTTRLCFLAFLVMLGYAIPNAAAQSWFLQAHGTAMLPWVWVAVALVTIPTVAWVNRLTGHLPVVRVFISASWVSAALLVGLLGLHALGAPGMPFCVYVWKDIYVIVLVELFWTFANVAFAVDSASRAYGWFCAAGSVGSVVGNLALTPLSRWIGTLPTLWLTLPILGLTGWLCRGLSRHDDPAATLSLGAGAERSLRAGWHVLQKSRFLILLLLLIGVVQITLTVMDFQFNQVVAMAYPEVDARTAVLGQVNAVINLGSLVLQLATGFLLRVLGLSALLIGIPTALAVSVIGFVTAPGFASMGVIKVLGKCVDYSLFRAAKEILYIPLSYAEKTQGKALVDMLTYRVAKGGASVLLLGLTTGSTLTTGSLDLALCGCWLLLTVVILRRADAK